MLEQSNHSIACGWPRTDTAFQFEKPAAVYFRCVNYIGDRDSDVRDTNLRQLEIYLQKVVSLFPVVELVRSDKLLEIMLIEKNYKKSVKPNH